MEARLDRPERGDADDSHADDDTESDPHPRVSTSRTTPASRGATVGGMETARRDLVAIVRASSPVRTILVAALLVAFVVVLLVGVWHSGGRLGALNHRRDEALASRADPADVAGDAAEAFRRFRATLRPGERFTLAFGPDVGRDQVGFYRLVALSYLYPAVATSDLAKADAVMVFGAPSPSISDAFAEVDVVDGVWLGRRRS
jgi:hypothetical protein